ncbi:hypothetical protein ACIQBJ_14060 [Kitasatospora sp. NPDC088391]
MRLRQYSGTGPGPLPGTEAIAGSTAPGRYAQAAEIAVDGGFTA